LGAFEVAVKLDQRYWSWAWISSFPFIDLQDSTISQVMGLLSLDLLDLQRIIIIIAAVVVIIQN
jgi:hypothetical protein